MNSLIGLCSVICVCIVINSERNAQNNISDNGAQNVVTVGVLFTFIGIAMGLYNFDTSVANMVESINVFLGGMKLAFVTSIIGMIFGLVIKFLQRNITPAEDNINALLKKILAEIKADSNATFQQELRELVKAIGIFAPYIKNLSESMNEQSKIFERLNTTLSKNIEEMQISIEQAEKNSAELLSATKNFQSQSLANDAAQLKILSDNTAQIVDMKKSFDKFLNDMANNFSKNFIAALNETIKNLNAQLQTQLGENFKELNAAVREVAAWQREYKSIVIRTTDELKIINETFNREVMGELRGSLKIFADSTEKNLSVQKNLANSTAQVAKIISQADESISHMQSIARNFGELRNEILNRNISLLQNHLESLTQIEKNFTAEAKRINGVALSVAVDTKQYLNDFNTASKDSMKIIRETIARYKTDLNTETESSLSKLHQLFESVTKNTDEQSGKAIKALSVALAKISEQMIDNYKVLVAKIAEVDALLIERRRAN